MKMKEVCRRTGLTERTVRFYVEQQLIHPQVHMVNGREYRSYSEQDIAELAVIANLRKAFFSIDEIRTMKQYPERINPIVQNYKQRQAEDAAVKTSIVSLLDEAAPGDFSSVSALAARVSKVTTQLQLPKRDLEPDFGRFDGTGKMERQLEYEKFLERQERRIRMGHVLVLCVCGGMLLQSLVNMVVNFQFANLFNLMLTIVFSVALYSGVVWVRYLLAVLASLSLISTTVLLFQYVFQYAAAISGWMLAYILVNLFILGASAVVLFKNEAVSEFLYQQKYG